MVNLRSLKLANNQLIRFPLELGGLTQLQELVLHNNPLVELPSSLRNTRTLDIKLQDNQLTVLPASLISHIQTDPVADLQVCDIEREDFQVDQATLPNECYKSLPLSLLELCQRQVMKNCERATAECLAKITQRLPVDLKPHVLNQKLYAPPLIQGKHIVYFYEVKFEDEPAESYTIPLYWDRRFYTSQDVRNMLAALKGGQVYLIPDSYFLKLAAQAQQRQENLDRHRREAMFLPVDTQYDPEDYIFDEYGNFSDED